MAAANPDPMLPRVHRVVKIRKETHDTATLELERTDGAGVSPFAPGQFNMLYTFGIGEIPISVSGDPQRLEHYVHTVRAVGAVSKSVCGLKRGDVVGVRGPFGSAWPVRQAEGKDVLLIAGGLGLAPLRPAVYHILTHRQKYARVVLLYGARTPQDMLYRSELEKWRGRFDLHVKVTVDNADLNWRGNVGVVTKLVPRVRFDPVHTIAMICGPEIMMRFMILELEKSGINDANIFISMERNMKCGIGHCGHCQFGPDFVCKDGPVFPYDRVQELFGKREI